MIVGIATFSRALRKVRVPKLRATFGGTRPGGRDKAGGDGDEAGVEGRGRAGFAGALVAGGNAVALIRRRRGEGWAVQ